MRFDVSDAVHEWLATFGALAGPCAGLQEQQRNAPHHDGVHPIHFNITQHSILAFNLI